MAVPAKVYFFFVKAPFSFAADPGVFGPLVPFVLSIEHVGYCIFINEALYALHMISPPPPPSYAASVLQLSLRDSVVS